MEQNNTTQHLTTPHLTPNHALTHPPTDLPTDRPTDPRTKPLRKTPSRSPPGARPTTYPRLAHSPPLAPHLSHTPFSLHRFHGPVTYPSPLPTTTPPLPPPPRPSSSLSRSTTHARRAWVTYRASERGSEGARTDGGDSAFARHDSRPCLPGEIFRFRGLRKCPSRVGFLVVRGREGRK